MDPVLINEWLGELSSLPIVDDASVALARELVREEASRAGLPAEVGARLVNVASELATNQLKHARGGEIAVHPIERGGVIGLEVCAADRGDGLFDPAQAFRAGTSTAGTLGIGLPAVTELSDEVDVDVRLGQGTCLRARAFAVRTRGREIGIVGRPCEGETVSGDGTVVCRIGRALLVAVIDGLGHGPLAREATVAAARAVRSHAGEELESIFHRCHERIAHTRGVAMTVVRIEPDGCATFAGVGNVAAYAVGPATSFRFSGSAAVVGTPGPLRRIALERSMLTPYDALALFTDGLTSQTSLDGDRSALGEAPVVIAQGLLERFGRTNDDALVLVAR